MLRDHADVPELRRRFVNGRKDGGYRLVALDDDGTFRAAAGFRIHTNFHRGLMLYVDDLVTVGDNRSKGYGKLLNDHLVELARDAGCATIELDSGVQRFDAHRFYLRERYSITAHHFGRDL